MIYVQTTKIDETKEQVFLIYYDLDNISQEMLDKGFIVESIPQSEEIQGKVGVLYYNPQTKEFFYEYINKPLTQEELLERVKLLEKAMDDLLLGGV